MTKKTIQFLRLASIKPITIDQLAAELDDAICDPGIKFLERIYGEESPEVFAALESRYVHISELKEQIENFVEPPSYESDIPQEFEEI
jgi:hypothetical protein